MAKRVQLKTGCVDDLGIHAFREAKTGRLRITGVTIDGKLSVPTLSFWRGMFGEVGLSSCVGPRFDEYTWFLRLRSAHPFLVFRYAVIEDRHGNALLLATPRDAEASDDANHSTDNVDAELDDFLSERLSHHWAEAAIAPCGFMDSPSGTLRPSLN